MMLKSLVSPHCESHSVLSDSLWPHGLHSPWHSPGQNTGVGSLTLLQGIFPTQGLNPGLLHCRQILYQPSGKGSPVSPSRRIKLDPWLNTIEKSYLKMDHRLRDLKNSVVLLTFSSHHLQHITQAQQYLMWSLLVKMSPLTSSLDATATPV